MVRAFALSAALTLMLAVVSGPVSAAEAAAGEGADTKEAKADVSKGQAIVQAVCAACHGPDGNATGPTFPKLAGQNEAYLEKQLHNFKAEAGTTVPTRPNAIMSPYAAALSDADIRNVAAYFTTQGYKPASAKSPSTVDHGRKIWRAGIAEHGVPACASCHGPNGAGIPIQYPRLAGQWGEYNEAELTAFKTGMRKNNAAMATIASRLSDDDIKAVADYAAGLR